MRRALLLCGVVSPLLYALADTLAGLQWDQYSFRDRTISVLAAHGAPSRPLFATLLVLVYLLVTALSVGVWKSAHGRQRLRIATGLLIGLSVLALTLGRFATMQPRGADQDATGALHLVEGTVAMLLLLAAMVFAAATFSRGCASHSSYGFSHAVVRGVECHGDPPGRGSPAHTLGWRYGAHVLLLVSGLVRRARY